MATKTTNTPKQPAVIKPKKPTLVAVGSDLRRVHAWFDVQSTEILGEAITRIRVKLRKGKPRLSGARLERVARIHGNLQERINRLSSQQERFTERLKGHYGHTGLGEIDSTLGKTLISTSASFAVDVDDLLVRIGRERFMSLVASVLDPKLLLTEAENDEVLKLAICSATRVSKITVSVTAPDSRRGKSGKLNDT